MDENGDGKLSKEEIFKGYETYFSNDYDWYEIEDLFDKLDTDKSGFIDYVEFIWTSLNDKESLSKENLWKAFDMYDKDGSGSISSDEIR